MSLEKYTPIFDNNDLTHIEQTRLLREDDIENQELIKDYLRKKVEKIYKSRSPYNEKTNQRAIYVARKCQQNNPHNQKAGQSRLHAKVQARKLGIK